MEADLNTAGEVAAAGAPRDLTALGWAAPQGMGPIPGELVERAQQIWAAQQEALRRLEEARVSAAKHLAALDAVPGPRDQGHSVYLDVTG